MCYSLAASVNAGVCLAVVGAVTVQRALRHDRRMLGFAVFPLVFAVHQLIEAVVWWSVDHPFEGQEAYRYIFTIYAFVVWSILPPCAAFILETDPDRRRFWRGFCVCGVLLAIYLTHKTLTSDGIDLSVVKHSLAYDPLFERPPLIVDALYLALGVIPLVAFDNRALRLFGLAVFIGFFYSLINHRAAWYSVWCMSSAIFSLILSFAIKEGSRAQEKQGAFGS